MAKNSFEMPKIPANSTLLEAAMAVSRELLPRPTCLTPGWCAAIACILEATSRKPGNVSPGKSFEDLSYDELCDAAISIVPILDKAATTPLGKTIRNAVTQSQSTTRSNANLGIIIAIAPLAAGSTSPNVSLSASDADAAINECDAQDVLDIYAAIKQATAGSLGRRDKYDIHNVPPQSIREAMRYAATTEPQDTIAALWGFGYQSLWDTAVSDLQNYETHAARWEQSIITTALAQLARTPDSLITRRYGRQKSLQVSSEAAALLSLPEQERLSAIEAFDWRLRHPCRINPGTTADLVAAALYVHLWNSCFRELF